MDNLKLEFMVLSDFLKLDFSTRILDRVIGHDSKVSKGWKSWEILKKYELKNEDKGKLFLYPKSISKKIILDLMKVKKTGHIDKLIKRNQIPALEKYRNTYVLAESEKKFYTIFSGETRNIIQSFFVSLKKRIGLCQYYGCKNKGPYDTVHLKKSRPDIFMECASRFKEAAEDDLFKYDVYKTMRCFLQRHKKRGTVCFLCKKHHTELHLIETKSKEKFKEFIKKIDLDIGITKIRKS